MPSCFFSWALYVLDGAKASLKCPFLCTMTQADLTSFEDQLLKLTESDACTKLEDIQSLWSGYGQIVRYQLTGSIYNQVVVKHICAVKPEGHPRGWNTDSSHQRKLASYVVEHQFYQQWSKHCDYHCKVPVFIGYFESGEHSWLVMEDLQEEYPILKDSLKIDEVELCLNWLANFHATFMNREPEGLWPVGTYWHLETRKDEWQRMDHDRLKEYASVIDYRLNSCHFKTLVHGDAKVANFCFSSGMQQVAAVDFQYVGGGCGMKDVNYLLGSCLSEYDQLKHEDELLNSYFEYLHASLVKHNSGADFSQLEQEWRAMYTYANADFVRFLLGWMPTHHKINAFSLGRMESLLDVIASS